MSQSALRLPDCPARNNRVAFPAGWKPRYCVTVDTEEEFDWQQPLKRTGHSLNSVPALRGFQEMCEAYQVAPIYLIDYPIATNPEAAKILGPVAADGRCAIGIQLHGWVNPPFDEELSPHNSFVGNLPIELERAKLAALCSAIRENFGVDPVVYRSGRYGIGPNTHALLRAEGVRIDTSVRARFDYSTEGGPDFSRHPVYPYWVDRAAGLAEFPLTTVYWGMLRHQGRALFPHLAKRPVLRSALSHAAMLERIAFTPEGISVDEAIRGIDMALDEAVPVLNFSFHSPSLAAGYTPYVRNAEDVDGLTDWWERVFSYLALCDVAPVALEELLEVVEQAA